ncbi:unnamed protein product [Cladocopium goreaui]|uniref:Protein disulfide isomerase-like 2-1 n=1 Tax=Cladocopium goreaui TaxID=2562237 RepID=A0A9P1FG90_9DINO|nr:unnamed protein product [Cladocopium goreaui]
MLDARKLQHQSHLTWQSRCAPRCVGDELPPSSWRERALKHRELCPVLQGRPPKLVEGNDGGKSIVNDVNDVKDMKVSEESALFSPDKDFDWQVELSRYIARRSAILALEAERSRQLHSEAFSANTESDDWTTEVPGAQAAEILSLKDTVAWKAVLEAISFERTQLRRGFSNKWPDSLWSPGCLADLDSESARSELCRIELQLAEWIKDLEALADGSDVIRQGLQAMPVVVLLRQLLCDFRIATGDLPGAATALAGAVATESGADPLRPPLLIGWEDSLSCNYLKAQQCFRLGWLALLAVGESRAAAQARAVKPVWYGVKVVRQVAKDEAYTEELKRRREAWTSAQYAELVRGALLSARPLLRDAGRLYKAERESSPKMNLLDKEEEWQLALECCEILTFELEAEVCHMLESPADEVKKILLKAVQHSLRVQASPAATTRLQRLVFGLRRRLLDKACPNEDAT